MKEKLERLLKAKKEKGETWSDTFDKISVTRGVDLKTVYKTVAYILDIMDKPNNRSNK